MGASDYNVVVDPQEKPDKRHDGDGENKRDCANKRREKSPIFPGVQARLSDMPLHELVVAAVWLPRNVEGVSQERNGADQDADADVDGHAHKGDIRNSAGPRRDGDDEREDTGNDIAEAGDETDDAVDPESEAGEGNSKGFVKQDLQGAKSVVAEDPGASVQAA